MPSPPPQTDANRRFATEVVQRLREAGFTAYWAGGCVRDLVRGVPPQDYDVATDAIPDAVRKVFGRRRTLTVGESFGVVVVLGPAGVAPVEVATFRTEGPYQDGRRPQSVAFSTPEQDAQRRDFTINGMFLDPIDERLLDFVGGRDDLERKIIRAIGVPAERMQEDKLRLLRAVRFAGVLGFQIEAETAESIRSMAPQLGVVSVERIAQELRKMLVHPNRRRCIELCRDLGLMRVMLPEWLEAPNSEVTLTILEGLQQPSFELAFAALMRESRNPTLGGRRDSAPEGSLLAVCRRLRFSNQSTSDVCWLHAHQQDVQASPGYSMAQLKRLLAHPLCDDLLAMEDVRTRVLNLNPAPLEAIHRLRSEWSLEEINPPPLLTGNDLIEMGHRPGPRLKELLEGVREAQLNRELKTPEAARDWVLKQGDS